MTLSEFTALVKDEANKGSTLDAAIPARIQMAVTRLERRYTMKYMEVFDTFTLSAAATDPRRHDLDVKLKDIEFLRYTSTHGRYHYLMQANPADVLRDDQCHPTGFWLSGMSTLWFDNTVQEDLPLEYLWSEYSTQPLVDDHWLLVNAQDCLLAETMKVLSTRAREPSWLEKYDNMLTTSKADLFRADQELRNTLRDYTMVAPSSGHHRARYPGDR